MITHIRDFFFASSKFRGLNWLFFQFQGLGEVKGSLKTRGFFKGYSRENLKVQVKVEGTNFEDFDHPSSNRLDYTDPLQKSLLLCSTVECGLLYFTLVW